MDENIKCKNCGGEIVIAKAVNMSFYTIEEEDFENESYVDYVNPDNLNLCIDVCLSCGDVQDAWLEEPTERLKQAHDIIRLRSACEEALEWLQHHGGDALPADEPGLVGLIANLEAAINEAQ